MDIIASFFICFIFFVVGSIKGIFVGYSLFAALVIFSVLALRRGFKFAAIVKMVYGGGKKTFNILQIFMLIGAIVASWMAAGTVPSIVYYGLKYINPNLFILSAFIVSSVVSLLIGTSFGTVGTVGMALIVMARSGNVSTTATAGAILAGAYFGDRGSPMSSSANLVAHITETDLYTNIKNMTKTAIIPLGISILAYILISFEYPISSIDHRMTADIDEYFNLGLIAVIPAILILFLSLFKVNVKLSMLVSIVSAILIAVVFQNCTIVEIVEYIISGYKIKDESYLSGILKGGGVISMLKVSVIVFISSGFTGIFDGTGMLKAVERYTDRANSKISLFLTTIIVSIITAAFGCTQVMAVMLTHMLMKKAYKENNVSSEGLAVDLENTAIVIAPLIPWNIACLVPLMTLEAGIGAIPFAVYLYVLPVCILVQKLCKGVVRTRVGLFPRK